jgi:hypothetical protein
MEPLSLQSDVLFINKDIQTWESATSPPRKMAVAVMLQICIWELQQTNKQRTRPICCVSSRAWSHVPDNRNLNTLLCSWCSQHTKWLYNERNILQGVFTSSCNRRLSHIQRTATLLWSQFSHEGWSAWFLFTDAAWRHSPGRWLTMLILWNTHTCREMWGFCGSNCDQYSLLPPQGQELLSYPEDGYTFLQNSGNFPPDYMQSHPWSHLS